jgi:hypothetical protein
VGGGVRPKDRARNAALRRPAPSPSFLRSALLRCVTSAPAESAPRGPRCARLPSPPLWSRSAGSAWPGARGARALAQTCRGVALRAVTNHPGQPPRHVGAGMPARTPPASLRLEGCAHAVADRSGCALLEHPRPGTPRLRRCASRCSLRPRLALSVPLRSTPSANRPGLHCAPALLRAASPGARTKTSS